MKEKTKTIELTERECDQIKACIFLSLWDDRMRYETLKAAGDPSYKLKDKLDYYDQLSKKFDW